LAHGLNVLTGFSALPLRLASIIGFAFTLFGLMLFVYIVLTLWIRGRAVPGFAFLGSAIALFSGAQLFALGILGEYLARVHFRMMDRPTYVVRDVLGTPDAEI
jgi:undecaprenyl-phosphate 4-deoxy-4-formamido-L-arabinose transferase